MKLTENGEKNRKASGELHEMLLLRYEPIAVKLVECGDDVPEGAIKPRRDLGKHLALCQAFALTRREKKTIFMEKDDHWCWNPLIGFGLVECSPGTESFEIVCRHLGINDIDAARSFFAKFPRLPSGRCIGIVIAPLRSAGFEPDLVLIYSNNAQLRSMVWAVKRQTGRLIGTQLDAIDSCVYACIPPLTSGEYCVTLPDVGEHERAMAGEDEIILSVPRGRLGELIDGLRAFYERGMGYPHHSRDMFYDFPRPEFYNELFEIWGLDQGEQR